MSKVEVIIPNGKYENYDAVDKVISYILRLKDMNLVGGYGILLTDKKNIIEQFYAVKQFYGKMRGKQIRHIIFSVNKTFYFSPDQVKKLGYLLAQYFGNERQVIFAVHTDTDHLHIHMGINTIAYTNGRYQAYWEIEELKAYTEKCIDAITDMVWFKKEISMELLS